MSSDFSGNIGSILRNPDLSLDLSLVISTLPPNVGGDLTNKTAIRSASFL